MHWLKVSDSNRENVTFTLNCDIIFGCFKYFSSIMVLSA